MSTPIDLPDPLVAAIQNAPVVLQLDYEMSVSLHDLLAALDVYRDRLPAGMVTDDDLMTIDSVQRLIGGHVNRRIAALEALDG